MTQKEKLIQLISEFCLKKKSAKFSLQELNRKYDNYENIGIGGKTPQATIRKLLQILRDENFLTFVDYAGNYCLNKKTYDNSESEELYNFDLLTGSKNKKELIIEAYMRDSLKQVVIERLGTYCLCKNCTNTFCKDDGTPYIEVHHIIPLCENGTDEISNLSVLCAHHHKEAHFASPERKMQLQKYLQTKVNEILLKQKNLVPKP